MDEQQTTQAPAAGTPIYQESQQKNAKWLWLLIILIIVGALIFAYVKGIGPFAQFRIGNFNKEIASPTPTSATTTFSSPTPEASASSNLDKSEPKIKVLNGSGTAGVASTVQDLLEGKGYTVVGVGNADNYDYAKTTVRFKAAFAKFQELLVSDLSDNYSVTVDEDELDASSSADIEVIVGAK